MNPYTPPNRFEELSSSSGALAPITLAIFILIMIIWS